MEMMKGVKGHNLTEAEIEVAQILDEFKKIHYKYLKWNLLRAKRSAHEDRPPQIQRADGSASCEGHSPGTPLHFGGLPSNTNQPLTKLEYLKEIEGLGQKRKVLTRELENVKNLYKKLKSYNSELTAGKELVLNKEDETQRQGPVQHHQAPPMVNGGSSSADPTVQISQFSTALNVEHAAQLHPPNSGPRKFVLDLNEPPPPEDDASMDQPPSSAHPPQPSNEAMEKADRQARYAEARRRRRAIINIRNMRKSCGVKLPTYGL